MMEAKVSVRDLHYEPDQANREKACMKVLIVSRDQNFNFDLFFQLRDQVGSIDETLEEGRLCLIDLFRAALLDLEEGELRAE